MFGPKGFKTNDLDMIRLSQVIMDQWPVERRRKLFGDSIYVSSEYLAANRNGVGLGNLRISNEWDLQCCFLS